MIFIKSFSLIELMVVIAIVSLLSVIALPTYKSYKVRTQIMKTHNFLSIQANKAKVNYANTDSWTSSVATSVAYPDPSNPLLTASARTILNDTNGKPRLYIDSYTNLDSEALILGGSTGYLAFVCSEGDNGLISCNCRTWPNPDGAYAIKSEYLPAECRCYEGFSGC